MSAQERPYEPPLSQRVISTFIIGAVGLTSRTFLYGLGKVETHGLDQFLALLDKRKDEKQRQRGLITVSNHLSVLDDPAIWGVLPLRYHWSGSNNARWSLGSYDICFKNGQSGMLSAFFTYGNTLPTQRIAHSQYGGLFQPTMTQCIRLLSDPHSTPAPNDHDSTSPSRAILSDPFSDAELTYSTNGTDIFPAPSAYPSRRYSWVHIFPEGMIHQHPQKAMRYFKWGVARLLLEAEPCPDLVPMWIDGMQDVMSETRGWPRPFPRPGKRVSVTFGDLIDGEATFGHFRLRWQELKERVRKENSLVENTKRGHHGGGDDDDDADETFSGSESLGVIGDDELRYGAEAEQLRIDVTLAVRNEVLKVRQAYGLPDEDPKRSLAETFRREGSGRKKREGEMDDQSIVKDM